MRSSLHWKVTEAFARGLLNLNVALSFPWSIFAFEILVFGGTSKPAFADWSPLIVTVHPPKPEQAPPVQPMKTEPEAGVALRATELPST